MFTNKGDARNSSNRTSTIVTNTSVSQLQLPHKRKRSVFDKNMIHDNIDKEYHKHHLAQVSILSMLNEKDDSNVVTKFSIVNDWFKGHTITFNSMQTLISIVGWNSHRKGRKKRKASIKINSHFHMNRPSYTAYICGKNSVMYLSSNHSNIFLQGFVNWFPNRINPNKRDLCAHYETKDFARKALIIKGFAGDSNQNIFKNGVLSNFLSTTNHKYIALFEKYNSCSHQFFGLISKTSEKIELLVPIDSDNELRLPWQVFRIV